ncbi:MAG: response regulator transcription factor [Acidobacteriota bacterium]
MTRVLIVAANRLYRDGLALLLAQRPGFNVVGATADRDQTVQRAAQRDANVVLLDLATPESKRVIYDLKQLISDVPIVALGVPDLEQDVLSWMEAGVAGYVSRDGSLDDLVAAVESAGRGELHCSPKVAGSLVRRVAALAAARNAAAPAGRLTGRERQIVQFLEQDLSNKEIATHLGIEVATVKNHVHNLLEKLNVHRRCEVGRWRSSLRELEMASGD